MPETILDVNDRALGHLKEMIALSKEFRVEATRLSNGSTLVDAGVRAVGGISAGLVLARVSTGGLATATLTIDSYGRLALPTLHVATDEPYLATMVCQLPIQGFTVGAFTAMCSGPGKVFLRKPNWVFRSEKYEDRSRSAVFIFQSDRLPDLQVADHLSAKAKLPPEGVYMIALSTASLTGAVLVASMAMEASVLRLIRELKYDYRRLRSVVASAPISVFHRGMWTRPGVTPDDMVRYGSRVTYLLEDTDDRARSLARSLTVESLPNFGSSFYDILKSSGFSFQAVEEKGNVFATSQVTIYNIATGKIYTAGRIHHEILEKLILHSEKPHENPTGP